jgi:hypothetical protein
LGDSCLYGDERRAWTTRKCLRYRKLETGKNWTRERFLTIVQTVDLLLMVGDVREVVIRVHELMNTLETVQLVENVQSPEVPPSLGHFN